MRVIHNLKLFTDTTGRDVTTPVLQAGSGAPHVVMVALQHGWEIIGLDTGLQVMRDSQLRGTLTLIAVASPLAYQDGFRLTGRQFCPSSDQLRNMNRVHPGNPAGNIADRSAQAIDSYIQSLLPDAVIDLHSYASQSLPHCIVDNCARSLRERIEAWMVASQNIWYREYESHDVKSQALDKALSAIWAQRGVLAITIELGPLNLFSPEQSRQARQALHNVLIAHGVALGKITDQRPKKLASSTWRRVELRYEGDCGGYLRPVVSVNTPVKQGDTLADIVIPSGEVVDQLRAPESGVHFIWHDDYRVEPGSVVGVMLTACGD